MLHYLLPAAALAAALIGWVGVQRLIARLDPGQPGVEGGCGSCSDHGCSKAKGDCESSGFR